MDKGKKKYTIKVLILTFPLTLILSFYFATDPFKVLHHYHFGNYYDDQPWQINRETAGLSILNDRIQNNDIPDSYILGNSASLVYHSNIWESFLNDHSKPFHFDASSESLLGVYGKIKYLDRHNIRIKNLLLVCDGNLLSKVQNEYDPSHIKDPNISLESEFTFQANYVKAYLTNFFFFKHIDYLIFGKIRNYMEDVFSKKSGNITVESYTNDVYYTKWDKMLEKDSVEYYVYQSVDFYDRKAEESEEVIKEKQLEMLKEIKRILDKDKASVKIVISPMYNQKKINKADLRILTGLFGNNSVFDYSGKNDITEPMGNYYNFEHYKAFIANKIMSEIYSR